MTSGWFIPTVVKICQWFGFQDGFFFSFLTLWQCWNTLRRMTHLIAMAKMWRVAPGEFWGDGTGAYEAHVHPVSHHTCKDIEQYREGIDVRLSNVLVRKAAEIFSTCACLTLLLIWETQKWQWLVDLISQIRERMCQTSLMFDVSNNDECSGPSGCLGSHRFVGNYYRPLCVPETLKVNQSVKDLPPEPFLCLIMTLLNDSD